MGCSTITGQFPFVSGHSIAVFPFRLVPDVKVTDLAVACADRRGALYRDGLYGVFRAAPLDALPAVATSLRAVDIDSDGWMDVAYASSKGISVAWNADH